MEFHEIAGIFPLMEGKEFEQLVEDIRQHGLMEPIWTYGGKILDGRNRYRACMEIDGIEPESWEWKGDSPLSLVISMNLKRRHLDKSQCAMIAVDVEPMLAAEAKERMLAGKKIDPVEKLPQGKARDKAGEMFGVSGRMVSGAKRIKEKAPDLAEEVREGKKNIPQASRELARRETKELVDIVESPTGKYRTIVIDPPWGDPKFGPTDMLGRGDPDYAMMTLEEIKDMNIPDLAWENDCHLYLWATSRSLPFAFDIVNHWGFRYITTLVWCKPSIGMGQYFRNSAEYIVFAIKGNRLLAQGNVGTWFEAPHTPRHSAKPEKFFDIVESCSPGPRLEMFARIARKNWQTWGAEL